MSPRLQSKL